jgi:resuscitation-promoting factor RpfB
MKYISHTFLSYKTLAFTSAFALFVTLFAGMPQVYAAQNQSGNEHLITIHDRGEEKSFISDKSTLREVFAEEGIIMDKNDIVEPGMDEKLVAKSYQVNIYRARPIMIVDGKEQVVVMSAYQTPKQIVENADMELRDEDTAEMQLSNNLVANGSALKLMITRAAKVNLVLYGKKETVYTQKESVKDFLNEKGITLGKKDTLSLKQSTKISEGLTIEIWRNGKQTITKDVAIEPPVEIIQDSNRKVGYEKITTQGTPGKKTVTYEVTMRNGKEVKREQVQSVVVLKPKKTVKVVGSKPSFGGDFADALAKLRSCEGGYGINTGNGYYGAYQFDRGTWNSVSSAPYGNATPAEEDAAARALYESRGWSPWPHCGASLPDIYR